MPRDNGSRAASVAIDALSVGEGSALLQQLAERAPTDATGSGRPRVRERKLSRRLVECLESM